jgi:hypothetical protein
MRLLCALPILGSLLGASASSLDSRRPDPHPLDARDDLDLCASIYKELAVPDLLTGASTVAGMLSQFNPTNLKDLALIIMFTDNVCICVSEIPLFIVTNTVAENAVNISGEDTTSEFLADLVRRKVTALLNVPDCVFFQIEEGAPACPYPDNGTPTCVNGDPCGFTCMNGYTASPLDNPTDCVCAPPNVVCNGQCTASNACPSSQATPQKRWVGSGTCTEMGHGWAACGVFGGGARAWECVNTARDLESCKRAWLA